MYLYNKINSALGVHGLLALDIVKFKEAAILQGVPAVYIM